MQILAFRFSHLMMIYLTVYFELLYLKFILSGN